MKEQIISVEPEDDRNSLRDKISRAQSARILMRWPRLEGSLRRRLDLELVRRWAKRTGSEVVIISSDRAVRLLAQSARVAVCADEMTAASLPTDPSAESVSDHSEYYAPRQPIPCLAPADRPRDYAAHWSIRRRFAIALAAVCSLAMIPLLALPAAHVHAVFPARSLSGFAALDSSQAAHLSISIKATGRRDTSGRAFAPAAFSTGSIQLVNTGPTTLDLPAGLVVSNILGLEYEAEDGVILEPGASASVPIRARDPGSASNLPAGVINRVDGDLAMVLHATNPAPTTGGAELIRGVVTKKDLEALQTNLTDALRRQAIAGLTAAAGPARMLAQASLQIAIDPADVPDVALGSPADSIGQTVHATASGLAFSRADLAGASFYILQSQLQPGEQLAESTVTFQIEPADGGGWKLAAQGQAFPMPDAQAVTTALRGQSIAGAQALLRERFGAAGTPVISLEPVWLPCLPLFPFRILLDMQPATG